MILLVFIYVQFGFILTQNFQCKNKNEVFNFLDKTCIKCDLNCEECFGQSQFDCISCKKDMFKLNYNNSCSNTCQDGKYLDQNSMTCGVCSVIGCSLCTKDQKCLQCSENLYLDQISGFCKIKNDICQEGQYYSLKEKKCIYICNKNQIEDKISKLCTPIIQCIQNIELSEQKSQTDLLQANILSNNQIVVQDKCSFTIYEDNFEVAYFIELQSSEIKMKASQIQTIFLSEDIGGCQNTERFIVYNFVQRQVEFQIDGYLNTIYTYYKIYPQHNITIFLQNFGEYIIYNYVTKNILYESNDMIYGLYGVYIINKSKGAFIIIEEDNYYIIFKSTKIHNVIILTKIKYFFQNNQEFPSTQFNYIILKYSILQKYLNFKLSIFLAGENIQYQLDLESTDIFALNDDDRTFLVGQTQSFKIFQLDKSFMKIQQLFSIDREKKYGLNQSSILSINEKKRIVMIYDQKNSIIEIYQHSILNNSLNLVMQIKDGYQQKTYQIFYLKNYEIDTKFLIITQLRNYQIFSLENKDQTQIKNLIDENIPLVLQYDDKQINSCQFYQNDRNINAICFLQQKRIQIYKIRIDIKDNKFWNAELKSLQKIFNKMTYMDNLIVMKSQKIGQIQILKLIYYQNQDMEFLVDFKIYLQNPLTYKLGKVQKQSYYPTQYQVSSKRCNIDENIIISQQNLSNKDCLFYLIDTTSYQILFQYQTTCIKTYSIIDIEYIKSKKMIFFFNQYALFDIQTNKRITNFSQFDQSDVSQQLIFANYKDEKLLFSNKQGSFFAFDLNALQFDYLINDSSIKITYFYYSKNRLSHTQTQNYQAFTINQSVYVQINDTYAQEYNFLNYNLNSKNKVEMPDLDKYQYDLSNKIYKGFILIPKDFVLNLYDTNLYIVDTINLPQDYSFSNDILVVEQFVFLQGKNKLYRIDLNTKQITYLLNISSTLNLHYIDETKKIIILQQNAIQYVQMVLLCKFTNNNKQMITQLEFNQSSILFRISIEHTYILNFENKPISQTSFSINQQLISSYISLNIQVAYYYDISIKHIIKIQVISGNIERSVLFTDTFIKIYVDYFLDIFIYTQLDGSLKVYDPNKDSQQTKLIQKFTNMTKIKFCYNVGLLFVQDSDNQIFIINVRFLYALNQINKIYIQIIVYQVRQHYYLIRFE